MRSKTPALPLALAAGSLALFTAIPALADLESYVKAKDDSFAWKEERSQELPGGSSAVVLKLTSQKWQGIVWEHWLYVLRPQKVKRGEDALLVISGGSIRKEPRTDLPSEVRRLTQVAEATGTVVAVLTQVPNQPIFGDLKEDALIAHTFMKFLETRDETWPCLFPMTKSAVRAMDALQAWAREKHSQELRRFTVTGASKRGWTTWLTAAMDSRVVALAPMVIDVLNMQKQMPHQVLSFGAYSEQIEDYTRLNLPGRQDPLSRRLTEMVDPYSYRQRLSMPKLIVLGTNDRYWPVDAVKFYFPDLVGEKYLHHLPNAGHGLGLDAVNAIAAFYGSVVAGEPRPRFHWDLKEEGGRAVLGIACEDAPQKVELWKAQADTRDFREASWTSEPLEKGEDSRYTARVPVPAEGFSAFFGRLTYASSLGHSYYLTTNVELVGTKARPKNGKS